jgi:hypothetical protein
LTVPVATALLLAVAGVGLPVGLGVATVEAEVEVEAGLGASPGLTRVESVTEVGVIKAVGAGVSLIIVRLSVGVNITSAVAMSPGSVKVGPGSTPRSSGVAARPV